MRLPPWLKLVLMAALALACLLLLEILIEYNWLGRAWRPSRLMINLVLLSFLVLIAVNLILLRFVGGWLFWIILFISSGLILYLPYLLLAPLFKNPAINWEGGQQTGYFVGLAVLTLVFYYWSEHVLPTPDRLKLDIDDFFEE